MKLRTKTIDVIDSVATGEEARALRESAGKTLREVGGKFKCSAAYLSDLELGRRNWTQETVERFESAVKGARK